MKDILQTIGNDVVDLTFPGEPLVHERYFDRVLRPSEFRSISNGINPWLFWAAKEAGYKAIARIAPTTPFIPRLFEFHPKEGYISYKSQIFPCKFFCTADRAAVVCASDDKILKKIINDWAVFTNDERLAIRTFALHQISTIHQIELSRLSISNPASQNPTEKQFPVLKIDGKESNTLLSFSHHGRFMEFAYFPGALNNNNSEQNWTFSPVNRI